VLVDTAFENTKTGLRDWFRVIHVVLTGKKGVAALEVQRGLGFGSYRTAHYPCMRVRAGLVDPQAAEDWRNRATSCLDRVTSWHTPGRSSRCCNLLLFEKRMAHHRLPRLSVCFLPLEAQKPQFRLRPPSVGRLSALLSHTAAERQILKAVIRGQLFPHIYGLLPVGAVVSVATLERTPDGAIKLPA
jgi:hypothetical protein